MTWNVPESTFVSPSCCLAHRFAGRNTSTECQPSLGGETPASLVSANGEKHRKSRVQRYPKVLLQFILAICLSESYRIPRPCIVHVLSFPLWVNDMTSLHHSCLQIYDKQRDLLFCMWDILLSNSQSLLLNTKYLVLLMKNREHPSHCSQAKHHHPAHHPKFASTVSLVFC